MAGYDIVPKEKNGNNLGVYNPEYANSTRYMKENGNTYALTYGSSGQFLGSTLVPDYDYNLGVDRSKLGGSAYDRFFMTNTELGRINDARRAAENGTGTWEDANSLAEGIRGSYGYSGGADGTGYTPTGQNVYSGIGSVRDPATLLSGNEQQQLANRLIGNYGNDYTAIVDGRVQTLTGTAQGADGYDNFLRNAQNAGLLGQFSESDLAYAQQNPNFGNALLQSKINYANAATPEQRALAQAEGESLRETMRQSLQTTPVSSGAGGTGVSGTGVSGGVAGSADTLNNIAGYNYAAYKAEPDYKALMDSWNNNGRLAMQGTLSQASARTGGLASSYGEGVAQQTYQQYMTEAEQEAYNRYRDALNDLYNLYSLQSSQEETMYQRALDAQQTEYNKYLAQQEAQQAQQEEALAYAQLAAQYGDYSYLNALGIDTSALLADIGTGGSGTVGSGTGGSGTGDTITEYTGNISQEGIESLKAKYGSMTIPAADWDEILSANEGLTADDLTAAGFVKGETSDTGYPQRVFETELGTLSAWLRTAKEEEDIKDVLKAIDRMWIQISEGQRAQLQEMLSKYGIWYEE